MSNSYKDFIKNSGLLEKRYEDYPEEELSYKDILGRRQTETGRTGPTVLGSQLKSAGDWLKELNPPPKPDMGDFYRQQIVQQHLLQNQVPQVPINQQWWEQQMQTPGGQVDAYEQLQGPGAKLPEGTRRTASAGMSDWNNFLADKLTPSPGAKPILDWDNLEQLTDRNAELAKGYTPGTIPEIMLHPDLQGYGLQLPLNKKAETGDLNSPDAMRQSVAQINAWLPYATPEEKVKLNATKYGYVDKLITLDQSPKEQLRRATEKGKTRGQGFYDLMNMDADSVKKALETERAKGDKGFDALTRDIEDFYYSNFSQGTKELIQENDARIAELDAEYWGLEQSRSALEGDVFAGPMGDDEEYQKKYDDYRRLNEQLSNFTPELEQRRAMQKWLPMQLKYQEGMEGVKKLREDPDFFAKGMYDPANEDRTYRFINRKPIGDKWDNNDFRQLGWDHLTPEELQSFNYIYHTEGAKAANVFLRGIQDVLSARRAAQSEKEWADYASKNGWTAAWATIKTVPANIVNSFLYPVQIVATMAGASPFAPSHDLTRYIQTTRGVAGKMAGEAINFNIPLIDANAGELIYGVATSLMDFWTARGIAKGAGKDSLAMMILSSSAGQSSLYNAMLSGKSPLESVIESLGSAAIEYLTEQISWGALERMPAAGKQSVMQTAARYVANQMATEGMEEGVADIANFVLSRIMYGPDHAAWKEIKQSVEADAIQRGETIDDNEISRRAHIRFWQTVGASALAGSIAGGASGAISLAGGMGAQIGQQHLQAQVDSKRADVAKLQQYGGLQMGAPDSAMTGANLDLMPQALRGLETAEKNLERSQMMETDRAYQDVMAAEGQQFTPQDRAMLELSEALRGDDSLTLDAFLEKEAQREAPAKPRETQTKGLDRAEQAQVEYRKMDAQEQLEALEKSSQEFAELLDIRQELTPEVFQARRAEAMERSRLAREGLVPVAEQRAEQNQQPYYKPQTLEEIKQELKTIDPTAPDSQARIAELEAQAQRAGQLRAEQSQIEYDGKTIPYKRTNVPNVEEHRRKNPDMADDAFDFAAEAAYSAGLTGSRTLFEVSAAIQDLAPETAKALFDAGLGAYNAQEGERRALKARLKDYMPKPGKGKLIIPKDVIQKMNPEQKKLAGDLQRFIIMAGVEGELFASETADESGRILDEEGSFDPATGRFTFDINAGINFIGQLANKSRGAVEFALPRVMGHEFTHYLKATAPELYTVFQESVIKELSAKNQLDDLILTELGRARKGALSIGVALEEVVARSSEMMFRDSQALARAMGENPTLWQKFKAWVTEFVQNLKDRMKGMNPAYAGAKSLIETGDGITQYVGDLQAKWDKALEQSITERMDTPGLRKTAPISPVTEGEGVALSPQEIGTEGAGIAGNEDGEQTRYSVRPVAPPMYSKMAQEIEAFKGDKMGAGSLINYLRGKGVKADEIRWSGIQTFLQGKKSVSKAELLEFAKGNELHIATPERRSLTDAEVSETLKQAEKEVVYKKDKENLRAETVGGFHIASLTYNENTDEYEVYEDGVTKTSKRKDEALLWYNDAINGHILRTASTYRRIRENKIGPARYDNYKLPSGTNYREVLFTVPDLDGNFQSSHWDEKNVLAHARMQDFETQDGKPVLFIEEVQSDWHEKGREEGYAKPVNVIIGEYKSQGKDGYPDIAQVHDDNENLIGYIMPMHGKYVADAGNGQRIGAYETEKQALDALAENEKYRFSEVPEAPFASTWHEYVMKRVLRMAAEGDYDYVAWTTGQMQADRYDLAKQVDAINAYQNSGDRAGTYNIDVVDANGFPLSGLTNSKMSKAEVINIFGKDIGARLIEGADNKQGGRFQISGEGLKVGGEGMKAFYDIGGKSSQNIPRFLNKYAGQWGAKVQTIQMGKHTVPAVEVTDKMRDSVIYEGQPLYSVRDSTGAPLSPQQVEFFKDSKVRDEQGRLLKVYHGTKAHFSTFRTEYGAFFTASKKVADGFAEGVGAGAYYLDFKTPLVLDAKGNRWDALTAPAEMGRSNAKYKMTPDEEAQYTEFRKLHEALQKLVDDGLSANDYIKWHEANPRHSELHPAATKISQKRAAYEEANSSVIAAEDLVEWAKEQGKYDGVIIKNVREGWASEIVSDDYIALRPEQVKRVDNLTPTADPDIRFSERDSDNTPLSPQQVEYFKDSKVRDAKDRLIPVYHGTEAQFNTFRRGDIGFHFGTKGQARMRAGRGKNANIIPAYLNLQNPLKINKDYGSWTGDYATQWLLADGYITQEESNKVSQARYDKRDAALRHVLKDKGYDGIEYLNYYEGGKTNKPSYIAFDSNQIKRTTNLTPTADPDIRYSQRDPENSLPSARAILGGAFGEVAQTDAEKKRVAEYRKSADRYNRLENELNNLLDRRKQLYRDKAPQSEKNELRADINALRDKLDKADRVLLNLQMSKPLRDVVTREVDKEYQRQKAKSQERQKEYREKVAQRDSRSKFIKSIEKGLNDLRKRLLTPDKKHYVPESLRKTINDLLQASDMAWTKADGTEVTSRRSKSWQEAMGNLMTQMQNADAFAINHGEIASPDFVMDIDPDLASDIQDLIRRYDSVVRYRDMGPEGLAAFDSIVKRVRHAVTGANNLHDLEVKAAVSDVAEGTLSDLQEKKDKKLHGPGIERLDSFLNLDMADAFSFFERLGPRSRIILDSLYKRGFGKLVRNTEQAREFFQNLDKKYKDFGIANWSGKNAQVHTFDIQGGTVHLTTGQVMELYLLNKREQARGHIYGKGLSIEQIKSRKAGKAAKLWQKNPVRVIENDVNTILGVLTNEQRAAADEIAGFLNTVSSQWGNEVSMTLYGYLKFVDPNYYPIHSDTNFTLAQDPSKNEMINALLNLGSTKNVIKGANNPVIISDIFDTVTRHITDMANYNAFAVPLSNAMKWFNYKRESVDEKGNPRMASVRGSIERTMGKDANRYFINLLKSVNGIKGTSVSTGFIGIINSAIGKFKTAAVAGNIRVVLQQHASYARAASMINPAIMAAAYAKSPKRGMQMARKYSPIAMWKHLGYYDMQIGREMTDLISGRDNPLRKVQEVTLKPAGLADDFTLGVLWNAIEIELGQTYEGDKRTEEFYKLVGDRLTDVIDRTQVVDTVFHRPQIMRDRDSLVKISTSFMAEPIKGYNMLVNAARSGDVGRIARTGVTFVATSILVAMAAGLSDALRDKEKEKGEEGFWDSYWSKVAGINGNFFESNIFDNINPLNMIPLGKDIWGIAGGYTPSRPDLQAVQRLIKAGQGWLKVFDGTAGQVSAKLITNTISALSTATGIPASNIYRDVMSVIDTLNPRIIVGEGGVPAKLMYERYASALLAGDEDKALEYYNALIESGTKLSTVHTGIRAAIKANFEAGKINRETYIQQMIDATDYDDIKNNIIKQWFTAGEIDEAEAKRLLLKFTDDDEAKEQFRTLERWKHVPENDEDSYRILNKFLDAVRTGKNLRAVVTEYTDPNKYAYDSKYLAGQITDAFKQEYIDNPAQRSRLKGYLLNAYTLLGYDREKKSGDIDRWLMKYDSADFENAIATGVNLKAVIDEKIKYSTAKNPKGVIISQVTAAFADQYKKMTPTERAKIKPRLIDAYVMLGYDRAYSSKKIDKWLTD